jgi:ADP-heptose:LPS heptosyltransferase
MRALIRLIIILLALIQSLFFWRYKKRVPHRILIAHHLLLGDTLLLAPLMKRIHERYPDAKKFILAKPILVPLFENTPYHFQALSFNPKSFLDLWKIFKSGPYDLTFVAGDNRYSWLARAVGSRWSMGIEGDTPPWKNWMLNEMKPFDSNPATWADMMGRLVDGQNPKPYEENEWTPLKTKKLISSVDTNKPYVVCHLGASSALRFWPHTSWQKLIEAIKAKGFDVVLSAGPREEHLIDEVDPLQKYSHVRGTFSLLKMWLLIKKSKLLISSDTGIAHLAKIAFVPSITLYGPGSPLIHGTGNFWRNLPNQTVTVDSFACRDQNLFFRRKVLWLKRCTRKINECKTPGACMQVITPEAVMLEVTTLV